MKDYSSPDAAQEETAPAETITCGLQVIQALQYGGKYQFTGATASLPMCKLQEDVVAASFPKESEFLH